MKPLSLSCDVPGVYSIAFNNEGVNTIVAKDLKVTRPKQQFDIKNAKAFECPATKTDQSVILYLMNERGEHLTGGILSLFNEFGSLEPGVSTNTVFESQELG